MGMNYVLLILGFVCVLLGVIGIFLPVLPTTLFLLLASALFLRSSKRWYDWLLNHPQLGPYVRDFILHRSIPIRIKVLSISMLWFGILFSVCIVSPMWLKALLLCVAIGVTIHILSFKTKK